MVRGVDGFRCALPILRLGERLTTARRKMWLRRRFRKAEAPDRAKNKWVSQNALPL
jgi:hypothetical protein